MPIDRSTATHSSTGRRPVAIDLFCGAGGLSVGLEQAGFDVAAGLDFDEHALGTFDRNHSGRAIRADIRDVAGQDLLVEAGVGEVDLLAGGPSCQGFSTHGKRFADDPRNFLYKEFLRVVDEVRPPVVLIENVKGMLIAKRGAFREEIYEEFRNLGYASRGYLLRAVEYGVPQRRERVVFLATRLAGQAPAPPEPSHFDHIVTVSDAIGDLPLEGVANHQMDVAYAGPARSDYQRSMRADAGHRVWNHVTRPPSEYALSLIRRIEQGRGLRSIPPDELPERFKTMRRISTGALRKDCTTLYHRLAEERPSYTITCYFTNVSAGAFTHPIADRALSPREAARLQSFPDSFRFHGSHIPRQIGNAVPPILARALGESVRRHLHLADSRVPPVEAERLVCV